MMSGFPDCIPRKISPLVAEIKEAEYLLIQGMPDETRNMNIERFDPGNIAKVIKGTKPFPDC
jgi:hypothetical protein